MWPILFRIGDLPVTSYGLAHFLAMVALAVFGAAWFRRHGADGSIPFDAAVAFPFALFGLGRIPYVLMDSGFTADTLRELPNILGGGFWGGFAFLILGLGAYTHSRRFPFWRTMDLFAPPVLLAAGIAKLGCFLNGCCWGGSSDGWFGLSLHPDCPAFRSYPEGRLHPVPLYDALWAVAGTVLLLLWSRRRPLAGILFLSAMAWYATGRFLTEFLRHSYIGKTAVLGLYASQWVELGTIILAAGAMGWLLVARRDQQDRSASARPVCDRQPPVGSRPARSIRRSLAFIIDIAPVEAAFVLALLAEGPQRGVLLGAAGILYLATQVLPRRTPGMALLGLRWIDAKGRAASVGRRLLRALVLPVSLCSLIGIFRPLVSSGRQGLHDMMAGVFVARA